MGGTWSFEYGERHKIKSHNETRENQNNMKQNKLASTMRNRNNSEEIKQSEESKDDKIVDPLTWFGAMVPRPICIAQSDFKNSLNLLVEMANIKQRLNELNVKWEQLK